MNIEIPVFMDDISKDGKSKEDEVINEIVKTGRIQRTDMYKHLGITTSTDGHLIEHIKEISTVHVT